MKKIHVLKFIPYFPPHQGGMESHVQEWSKRWIKKGYGEVINITTPTGQEEQMKNKTIKELDGINAIIHNNTVVGYRQDGYQVVIIDAFDIIYGYPFPKFWTKRFRFAFSYLTTQVKKYGKEDVVLVNTHTRFFLTSVIGGIFAKYCGIKRVHIEHGVDFVKLASKITSSIAYFYDQIVGRLIFKSSDMVIGISLGCKKFANKFTDKNIPVIYRGMDFESSQDLIVRKKKGKNDPIIIGFVGRLVKLKGVDLLIQAFNNVQKENNIICLKIVGDGDQLKELQNMVESFGLSKEISFLGFKDRKYIASEFLPAIDIVVNPSYQEGLPTSVLEGLLSQCVVVATDVGGTSEISDNNDLILVEKGDLNSLQKGLEYAINNYETLRGLSYQHVKDSFDREKSIKKYHDIYQ